MGAEPVELLDTGGADHPGGRSARQAPIACCLPAELGLVALGEPHAENCFTLQVQPPDPETAAVDRWDALVQALEKLRRAEAEITELVHVIGRLGAEVRSSAAVARAWEAKATEYRTTLEAMAGGEVSVVDIATDRDRYRRESDNWQEWGRSWKVRAEEAGAEVMRTWERLAVAVDMLRTRGVRDGVIAAALDKAGQKEEVERDAATT